MSKKKILKHLSDFKTQEKFRKTTCEKALPLSVSRLSWLKDSDGQLHQLLEYLESIGIPMGSDTWATRTLLEIQRLKSESYAAKKALRCIDNNESPDLDLMRDEFNHAESIYVKNLPPVETLCDYCGWGGAQLIGDGSAACKDCL